MRRTDLHMGDLCIIVNAKVALNNGVLVVIAAFDRQIGGHDGEDTPYFIRRVDGLPHAFTENRNTGFPRWYSVTGTWCSRYKLKKVEPGGVDPRDTVVQVADLATEVSA